MRGGKLRIGASRHDEIEALAVERTLHSARACRIELRGQQRGARLLQFGARCGGIEDHQRLAFFHMIPVMDEDPPNHS